jgi:hypothetical protein
MWPPVVTILKSHSSFAVSLFYPEMSKANALSGVSPALSQPYSDPALAAIRRIEPNPGNPKGYPPYELSKVPGYTNT